MDWPILVDSPEPARGVGRAADDSHRRARCGARNRAAARPGRGVSLRVHAGRFRTLLPESDAGPNPTSWPQAVRPADGSDAGAWRAFANLLVQSGRLDRIDEAIEAYGKGARARPGGRMDAFPPGRGRYANATIRPIDGSATFKQPSTPGKPPLDIDPNQYIWRRRIQQYGPRLDKPYPFYDWGAASAREEIAARGETPVGLTVGARRRGVRRAGARACARPGAPPGARC